MEVVNAHLVPMLRERGVTLHWRSTNEFVGALASVSTMTSAPSGSNNKAGWWILEYSYVGRGMAIIIGCTMVAQIERYAIINPSGTHLLEFRGEST
jgi:hypothetical protein